jgi:hypothetical protein
MKLSSQHQNTAKIHENIKNNLLIILHDYFSFLVVMVVFFIRMPSLPLKVAVDFTFFLLPAF